MKQIPTYCNLLDHHQWFQDPLIRNLLWSPTLLILVYYCHAYWGAVINFNICHDHLPHVHGLPGIQDNVRAWIIIVYYTPPHHTFLKIISQVNKYHYLILYCGYCWKAASLPMNRGTLKTVPTPDLNNTYEKIWLTIQNKNYNIKELPQNHVLFFPVFEFHCSVFSIIIIIILH